MMIPMKPSDSIWTDEQWQAIWEEGKNIIVSAGAGSGKTAVLTERVIRKLKDGILVNRLLILTFTKAAAMEMKDRIRKKMKKDKELLNQLNLLDSSYITTFDSFALSIVQKYHYLLNLPSNINIIDDGMISLEKDKIMEDIFLEYYDKRDSSFLKMIDSFCVKDDLEIRNYILNISNQLDLRSDKKEYLSNYLNNYFKEDKLDKDILSYVNYIRNYILEVKDKVEEISYIDNDFACKLNDSLESLYECYSYDELVYRVQLRLPNVPRGSSIEVKTLKQEISDCFKEMKKLVKFHDIGEIKDSIMNTYSFVKVIIDIILKFTDRVMDYKYKYHSFEFNDIAVMAIDIVRNYDDVRLELKNQFQEIMIDEYQDTNDLQEEFISFISKNNTYMVGDIKQSIYRFRNANPYIFKDKYDRYSNSNSDLKIDLNRNFRSRSEVISNINTIFNLIMNDSIGGANYSYSHQMIFGNNKYLDEKSNCNYDMEVYQYEYDKDSLYNREEIEAFMIANDIKKKINEKELVFDKDSGKLRDIRYNDFAIIMDRSSSFSLYKKIFNYFGIPITLYRDEKMNDEGDILVVCNLIGILLKVKNHLFDSEFKYYFVSVCRSFLLDISDEEISSYFLNNNFKDSYLYRKCLDISKVIDYKGIYEVLAILLKEFNYYEAYIKIGNVQAGIVKINKLLDTARNLEDCGYTLDKFFIYLKELLKNGYNILYHVPFSGEDSVKLMTIHKSKGLEYPICYFSGLYKKFNISDLKERFLVDKKWGLVVPYFDEGIGSTIYKDLVKNDYIKEEVSEKIRLFYVDLTRAREKIIMVCPYTDKDINSINDRVKIGYRSFLDILDSIYFKINSYYVTKDINKLGLSKDYLKVLDIDYKSKIDNSSDDFTVKEILIKEDKLEKMNYSKKTVDLITDNDRKKMELGTKMHEYLEYLDLKKPNYDMIDDDFCKNKIKAFLNTDLLKDINRATIYQEYEFFYEEGEIFSHGIIDLMLEYDNYINIIDYKLKNVSDNGYQKQLEGYANYIKSISKKKVNIYLYSLLDEKFTSILEE